MWAQLLLAILVATALVASAAAEAPGIQKFKDLGFEIKGPQERSRMVGGVSFGPGYRWCKITPESYVAKTEPGMLKHLLDDKSINSLDLHPGPWPFQDVPDEYIDLDDAVLKDLAVLTHLKQLRATNLDFATAERIAFLKPLNDVTHLEFNTCDVTLKDLARLGPSDKLVSVWIDNTWSKKLSAEDGRRVSKVDILELAKQFPNLERIYYKSHVTFDAAAVEGFGAFKKLKYLHLGSAARYTLDHTQAHLDAHARIKAPVMEALPEINFRISVFCVNWEELRMRPPIKQENDD